MHPFESFQGKLETYHTYASPLHLLPSHPHKATRTAFASAASSSSPATQAFHSTLPGTPSSAHATSRPTPTDSRDAPPPTAASHTRSPSSSRRYGSIASPGGAAASSTKLRPARLPAAAMAESAASGSVADAAGTATACTCACAKFRMGTNRSKNSVARSPSSPARYLATRFFVAASSAAAPASSAAACLVDDTCSTATISRCLAGATGPLATAT
mmetsp:Transcript_7911/g.19672  ORF Transcript_7911/g.19672 Transcript_7911/m.19672 type:complete len:215 (+) Transcript_7911:564-1208(+)